MARIAVMVGSKGRGSNMRRLIEAGRAEEFPGRVECVLAPTPDSPAVQSAREMGIPTTILSPKSPDYPSELARVLEGMDLVCLAGFMSLFPAEVLAQHPGRVLNIHPALLPKFGGKGMYGMHVHQAVLAAGERESGCTVHLVTPIYDEGRILVQLSCPVEPEDSPEVLAARVLRLEHQAYPLAVRLRLDELAHEQPSGKEA